MSTLLVSRYRLVFLKHEREWKYEITPIFHSDIRVVINSINAP